MADDRIFSVEIITPDRIFYQGEAEMIEFTTVNGEIGVYKNHIPLTTVLAPGMVVSMEPMIMLPENMPGHGGYREHDILVVTENAAENITHFPYGPEHNIIEK